jgi:hypothetical protein
MVHHKTIRGPRSSNESFLRTAFEFQNYKKEQHINTNTVLVNEKTKAYLLKVVTIGQPHLS